MKRTAVFCAALLLFPCSRTASAQTDRPRAASMNFGESVTYDVYFKWGLIMPRAGDATFSYSRDYSVDNASSLYRMQFKSTKFFDSFFKMRDTLSTYYNHRHELVYSLKKSDEGGYYSIDRLAFSYGNGRTQIHSLRYTPPRVKIDTVLTADGEITDLLGVVYFLRGIERRELKSGDAYPMTVVMGRDLVKILFTYRNQAIVEREKEKFNTRYFVVDIYDEAFESAKTSAEVWIGDDDNFLPVKVRSKLKIGYAEVYYKESSNLAHPLTCRIIMK